MKFQTFGQLERAKKNPLPARPVRFCLCVFAYAIVLWFVLAKIAGAETASYYTYQSCVREGTSGVWTASGERFNENDLTAAMWGVKFGTLVKVTNLANGKSVVVKINDRGPSKRLVKKGRVIDLSKGAFLRLANLKAGVIKVKVEVLA
jgi:rare lipoprotein A